MADSYTVIGVTMDKPISTDPMGKVLGKQAAIVLAYSICQYTHDTIGIIKNEEKTIFLVEYDIMTNKPYLVPVVEESVTAYISQRGESYTIFFHGYIDVREYINMHDGLSWDKDSFREKCHPVVCIDNSSALEGFLEYLEKANVTIKWNRRNNKERGSK